MAPPHGWSIPATRVIVVSYAAYSEAELSAYEPKVVHVDARNSIVRVDACVEELAA